VNPATRGIRVGLTPGDLFEAVRIGLAGETVSRVWIGQRRHDLVVRLQGDQGRDAGALVSLLIDRHDVRPSSA
jgi:heavy metal efflux system protein